MYNNSNDKDLELWLKYKQGNNQAKWELLKNFHGIITSTARKQSNVRPYSVVEAELKELTLKAFDTYDPAKGVKLSTHVMNNYKKLSRENIMNQHAIRVPENVHFKFKPLIEAEAILTDELGRDPTHQELADRIGWELPKVVDAASRLRKELVESKQTYDPQVYGLDASSQGLIYAYDSLDNEGKYILEHTTGFGGKQELKDSQIQKNLKLTGYAYNKKKNYVLDTVRQGLQVAYEEE